MAVSKEMKFDHTGSRDNQFNVWNVSSISESKKLSLTNHGARQKLPVQLTDDDILLEEILFETSPTPMNKRKVHLTLKQTRILTTLLPNAIINMCDFNQDGTDNFVGVLLFADVTGFTMLCEKYKGFGKSGSDKLTVTLNSFLGAMVEVIYKHGGDVLKFSGDALLALWKLENHEYMYTVIHRVVCCALYIQRSIGAYETDVKVLLKVKLAISAGNMTFSVIGNDNSRHYLVAGLPVFEVKAAERVCTSGEVVLSLSAWGHLSAVNYEYYWKNSEHVKIIRIIYNPENTKREILHLNTKESFNKSEFHAYGRLQKEIPKRKDGISVNSGEVRSVIEEMSNKELNSELKTFLIPSVIQQIDADLPMEYLSEMRNVTIMFVNIVPNRLNTGRLINLVDQAYIIICSLAYTAMGSVNKVTLFDKDVMILVIFGLRGFSHEGEVAACLKCGYDIRQACCTLEGVFSVSVGVTTGQAYCGVVGHPLRREYTVMGPVVNKAARIMCAYPGKVTCDRDTFMFSNLAAGFFKIQEKKYLKGIEDTGPIYEFTREKSKNTLAAIYEGMYPILARSEEIHIFRNTLGSITNPNSWEKAILIKGSGRIGKTRLLDEMIIEAHSKGIKSVVIALHTIHSSFRYGTAQSIIKQILEIPDSASVTEKEEKLSVVLKNHIPLSDYWYLNEMMNVKFPQSNDGFYDIDSGRKLEKIKKIFHIILLQGTKCPLLAIDDIDFCDELSWKLLLSVIDKRVKFLIMTMPNRLKPTTAKFLKFPQEIESHILKFSLAGLPNKFLAILACQILNAKAVPVELERILIEKSQGNPGWCESFLLSLCQSNVLKVEELSEWHIRSMGLVIPPEVYLRRIEYRAMGSDPVNAALEIEKSVEVTENELVTSVEDKSSNPRKKKYSAKSKLVRFFSGKSEPNMDDYLYTSGSIISYPEEAYEDLKQRIQQVRFKSKEFRCQSCDANETDDHDTLSEIEIPIDDGGKRKSVVVTEPNEICELESFGCDEFKDARNPLTSHPGTTRPSISFSTESLKQIINEIHHRFLRRSSVALKESEEMSPGELRIQSLFDLRDITKSTTLKSKSAERLLQRVATYINRDVRADKILNSDNDIVEILPSILWKSHMDILVGESINLFVKNKAKNEAFKRNREKSEYEIHSTTISDQTVIKSTSSIPLAYNSHQPLTADYKRKEIRENFQRNFSSPDDLSHGMTNEIPARELESEHRGEEKTANGDDDDDDPDDSSIPLKKKGSLDFIKFSRTNFDNTSGKFREKNRGWKEKLFHRSRKQSGSPETDSTLVMPMEFEENNILMPAILINPGVKLDEVKTPEYFAGIIMTAFDCLRPYEQLMLKCGSIIGERFTRKMLNAIMHHPNPFLMAEAVKRLFEMKILCCGAETRESISEKATERQCFCTLHENEIVDKTMPKYSFCRVLLFRFAMFRSTLYELMPLEQKREFHIRAVEFLENEKIFCNSCKRFRTQVSVEGATSTDEPKPSLSSLVHSKTNSSFESEGRKKSYETGSKKTEMSPLVLSSWLPSFQQCNCLVLEADTLGQLINHSIAAGLRDKEIYFIMKYSSLMITLGQFEEAQKLLGKIEAIVKSPHGNPFPNRKQRRLCMGRIYLLLGSLYLELGELKKSNSYLWSAMKCIGWRAPPSYFYGSLEYMFQYLTQIVYQRHPKPFRYTGKVSRAQDYNATCLSLSCNVFMIQGKWKLAKLVALRNLNFLWMNGQNLIELCNAYSNAVDIYRQSGNFKFCRKLENAAAKSCIREFGYTTALEVIAFGRLNCSVMNARLISGYLTAASKLGEMAVKLSQSISSYAVESYIISKVAMNMIMMGKLDKGVGLILHLSVHDIWHYILSLEFILETGFVIESSDICLNAISEALRGKRAVDYNTYHRAVSTIYVWFARIGEYEEAENWRRKLPQVNQIPFPGDTVDYMISVMKVLEGDLLILGSYPDDDPKKNNLSKKATTFMQALRKSTKKTAIILPRFLHLRAYDQYRLGNLEKAMKILAEAKEISDEQGNALEKSWISHNRRVLHHRVWTNTCDFDVDFWIVAAKNGKLKKWSDIHDLLNWKNYMYSLK